MNPVDSPLISTSVPADSVVTRRRGESVTFSVKISKDTPAIVKWFFNGTPLISSPDRHLVISNEQNDEFDYRKVWAQDLNVSLYIDDVTFDDMGFYQVEISNPVETVLLTYSLIVEDLICKYVLIKLIRHDLICKTCMIHTSNFSN